MKFVIKNVRFHCSQFSKVAKMIYNSISDACMIIFVSNLAIQSLEFGQKLHANFTKTSHIFHNGCMALTSLCCIQDLYAVVQKVGQFKMTFFWYQFMNLIFIYYSRKGGVGYWRGVLVGRNILSIQLGTKIILSEIYWQEIVSIQLGIKIILSESMHFYKCSKMPQIFFCVTIFIYMLT